MTVAFAGCAGPSEGSEPAPASESRPMRVRFARLVMEELRNPTTDTTTTLGLRVRACTQAAARLLVDTDDAGAGKQLTKAATAAARQDLPLDAMLRRVNEVLRNCLHRLAGYNVGHQGLTAGTRCIVDMLDTVGAALLRAYAHEARTNPVTVATDDPGIVLHGLCTIVALSFPAHIDTNGLPVADARRTLRRVKSELVARTGDNALSALSTIGGTIVLPGCPEADSGAEALIAALSRAARTPITAAVITGEAQQLSTSVDTAHTILDMVHRLGGRPGVYTFDNFALEYQLTRPGPGRRTLAAFLAPLDDHPELLETLQIHITNNLSRKRTAEKLSLHPNTVDYRLNRIHQLTGIDPSRSSEVWQLQSALVARVFRFDSESMVRNS
ncbi:helix-turn-helix domain-containing protein [Nocardia sp. NPDC050193]